VGVMSGRKRKSDFLKWREKNGISLAQASEYFACTPRSIRNWDKNGAPALVMRLIALAGRRDLSGFHPSWKGWTISHTGKMHGPGGAVVPGPRNLVSILAAVEDYELLRGDIERQERERMQARSRIGAPLTVEPGAARRSGSEDARHPETVIWLSPS
jgi:hypothetical protein